LRQADNSPAHQKRFYGFDRTPDRQVLVNRSRATKAIAAARSPLLGNRADEGPSRFDPY